MSRRKNQPDTKLQERLKPEVPPVVLTEEERKKLLLERRLKESDNRADRRRAEMLDRVKPGQSQYTKKKRKGKRK